MSVATKNPFALLDGKIAFLSLPYSFSHRSQMMSPSKSKQKQRILPLPTLPLNPLSATLKSNAVVVLQLVQVNITPEGERLSHQKIPLQRSLTPKIKEKVRDSLLSPLSLG